MLSKEIKTPMIVGIVLYGIAVLIDLCSVLAQQAIFPLYGDFGSYLDEIVVPAAAIQQIVVMLMFIVFLLILLRYKGNSRKTAGITMIVVYCLIGIISPYLSWVTHIFGARLKGSNYLAALTSLENFIAATTTPFTVVASVFVIIALGRYIISKPDNEE